MTDLEATPAIYSYTSTTHQSSFHFLVLFIIQSNESDPEISPEKNLNVKVMHQSTKFHVKSWDIAEPYSEHQNQISLPLQDHINKNIYSEKLNP